MPNLLQSLCTATWQNKDRQVMSSSELNAVHISTCSGGLSVEKPSTTPHFYEYIITLVKCVTFRKVTNTLATADAVFIGRLTILSVK